VKERGNLKQQADALGSKFSFLALLRNISQKIGKDKKNRKSRKLPYHSKQTENAFFYISIKTRCAPAKSLAQQKRAILQKLMKVAKCTHGCIVLTFLIFFHHYYLAISMII
jgi:hypothetical protein